MHQDKIRHSLADKKTHLMRVYKLNSWFGEQDICDPFERTLVSNVYHSPQTTIIIKFHTTLYGSSLVLIKNFLRTSFFVSSFNENPKNSKKQQDKVNLPHISALMAY